MNKGKIYSEVVNGLTQVQLDSKLHSLTNSKISKFKILESAPCDKELLLIASQCFDKSNTRIVKLDLVIYRLKYQFPNLK
jgi:hypothetical protein